LPFRRKCILQTAGVSRHHSCYLAIVMLTHHHCQLPGQHAYATLTVCTSTTPQYCISFLQTTTLLLSLQAMGEAAHSTLTQIDTGRVNLFHHNEQLHPAPARQATESLFGNLPVAFRPKPVLALVKNHLSAVSWLSMCLRWMSSVLSAEIQQGSARPIRGSSSTLHCLYRTGGSAYVLQRQYCPHSLMYTLTPLQCTPTA